MTDAMFHPLIKDTPWPATPGTRTALGPLPGAASTAVIAELALNSEVDRPLVVLVASSAEANMLERELPLFLPEPVPVLTLPDWETLPYDHFRRIRTSCRSGSAPFMSYPSSAKAS